MVAIIPDDPAIILLTIPFYIFRNHYIVLARPQERCGSLNSTGAILRAHQKKLFFLIGILYDPQRILRQAGGGAGRPLSEQ